MLVNALAFEQRRTEEVMVNVAEIVGVDRSTSVAEAEQVVMNSGHSRLLVRGPTATRHDEVLGFVHAKDLMAVPTSRREHPISFGIIRMTLRAKGDASLGDVLAQMRRSRRHVALIDDGAGELVGMVTMEDILEEIVGDIVDESDRHRAE